MSFLKDNIIVIDASHYCGTINAAAKRLSDAGYQIGMVGAAKAANDFQFMQIDPDQPLPGGVVACVSADTQWLEESCSHVPHLVALGAHKPAIAKAYPTALSWAEEYLAPRVPRINRSQT